jgi:hypothetical protein
MCLAVDPLFGDGLFATNPKGIKCIFQDQGISPKLQELVQPSRAHQRASYACWWTGHLVTAPLCNHTETKGIIIRHFRKDVETHKL